MNGEKMLIEVIERFELLKNNVDNLCVRELLEMAARLEDFIRTNAEINAACEAQAEQAEIRKGLLDGIKNFQKEIIDKSVRSEGDKTSANKTKIADFDKAKTALADLADEEIEHNMFSETEEPKLYSKVSECKSHIVTLQRVAYNCKKGKYIVLIMGDFQSGKSTTLDALCDGIHVSAIGDGIATSAVLVSVTYAEKESATIIWRTKEEFKVIFSKIEQYLPDFDWKSFDLDNSDCRARLADAIESLRNGENCPNVGVGNAKFLMLCDMVLNFYGSPNLAKRKSAKLSISDIAALTRFPKNGENRWKKSGMAALTLDESLFIFIEMVECSIPSKTLKYLNCTLIDSPGLFNSSYDTMVTENAMVQAHAIIYLLPYQKGMGQDDKGSLNKIKNDYPDVHRKLFIVNNLRSTEENSFFDSNCNMIHSWFGDSKTVMPYDAKLSYLAQLKLNLSSLTDEDYKHLMKVQLKIFNGEIKYKTFSDFDEAWKYHTKAYDGNIISDIASAKPEEILQECGFRKMIEALKKFIEENEAYSVILSNGINPLQREMEAIKASLYRLYVEPYVKSREEMASLWKTRIEKAEYFQTKVTEMANSHIFGSSTSRTSLLDLIADEEYSKLFTDDFYEEMTKEICYTLYDKKKDLLCTKKLLKRNKDEFKKRFKELSTPWIQKDILDLLNKKINYWYDILKNGQDKTVSNMFTPEMKNLEMVLQKVWEGLYTYDKNFNMKDYLNIPQSFEKVEHGNNKTKPIIDVNPIGINSTLFAALVSEITLVAISIASYIASYIAVILLDPTGAVLLGALGLGVISVVLATMAPDFIRNKFAELLSKKIGPKIKSEKVKYSFKEMVKSQMKSILTIYVDNLKVNLHKMRLERDTALNPDQNQETSCFRAVESIISVKEQLGVYEKFKDGCLLP